MNTSMYRAVFVDDRSEEQQYMTRLARVSNQDIAWSFSLPDSNVEKFADGLFLAKYDLIVLDYRLDEVPNYDSEKQVVNRYRAATLAQYLRERGTQSTSQDVPIVVLSQEPNVHQFYDPDLTAHDLFDLVLLKKEINNDPKKHAKRLLSLIDAYAQTRIEFKESKTPVDLLKLLALGSNEQPVVDFQDIAQIQKLFAPHQIIRELHRIFIARAGILLSKNDICARLGISLENAEWQQLEILFRNDAILYTGVLSSGWQRWWRHRFEAWIEKVVGSNWGALTAAARTKILNSKLSLSLTPAVSRFTGDSEVLTAVRCISCNQPTELNHTVPSYEPRRYLFLEKQRVCWQCVRTGEYEQASIELDSSAQRVINRLKNGEGS